MEKDHLAELAIKELRLVAYTVSVAYNLSTGADRSDDVRSCDPMTAVQRHLTSIETKLDIIIPIIESRLARTPPEATEPRKKPRLPYPEGAK